MSGLLNSIKNNLTQLPYPIGLLISYMPYEYRLSFGNIYSHRKREIITFEKSSIEQTKEFIFIRTKTSACMLIRMSLSIKLFINKQTLTLINL